MSPTHVALAGATGNLGLPVLNALLAAGYTVIVLSRIGGSSSKLAPHSNLTIKEVDFTSVASLEPALAGVEVVVAALATSMIGNQRPLIDAAVQAGVQRFIPAAFGMDSCNPRCIELPIGGPKAAVQDYLSVKSRESEGAFTWTALANGWFLDWVLEQTTILMDLKEHKATLYNGGETRVSATLLADIAKAVIGVIEHREETRNRVVYVHSAVITQKQLIEYAKEKDGRDWATSVKSTEELLQDIWADVSLGNVDSAGLKASIVGCSDAAYGCDYTSHDDNELLGVKKMSEADVKGLVQSLM